MCLLLCPLCLDTLRYFKSWNFRTFWSQPSGHSFQLVSDPSRSGLLKKKQESLVRMGYTLLGWCLLRTELYFGHFLLSTRSSNINSFVLNVCIFWQDVTAHTPIQFVINHREDYGLRPECWSLAHNNENQQRLKFSYNVLQLVWPGPLGNVISRFFLLKSYFLLKSVGR